MCLQSPQKQRRPLVSLLVSFSHAPLPTPPSRCSTGYHGNPEMPGGRCEECKCSSWGALPGPCDPVTGQCRCRVGTVGKSCDQCMERHVCGPTGIICKTNTQRHAPYWCSFMPFFFLPFYSFWLPYKKEVGRCRLSWRWESLEYEYELQLGCATHIEAAESPPSSLPLYSLWVPPTQNIHLMLWILLYFAD